MQVTKCAGEGQGSCKKCTDNGIWNRNWMSFLYKIDGLEGCYCNNCAEQIIAENNLSGELKSKEETQ